MGTRRTFTKEFKAEAVALVKQQGLSINKVATDLGVTWSQVDTWIKQHEADSGERPEMLTTDGKVGSSSTFTTVALPMAMYFRAP
jgi:transposase